MTWRVKQSPFEIGCPCKHPTKGACVATGIPDSAVYQKIESKKYYATVSDGGECYGMYEVEEES